MSNLNVKYGGYWNHATYEGGVETDIFIPIEDMTHYGVRYRICNYCGITTRKFEVYYLRMSGHGRIIKTRLRNDDQVIQLFRDSESPTVYVCEEETTSSSYVGASSSHAAPFEGSQSNFGIFEQSQAFENDFSFGSDARDLHEQLDHLGRIAASSNWDENQYLGESGFAGIPFHASSSEYGRTIPDLNDAIPEGDEESPSDDESEDDDDDYVPTRDTSSESEGNSNMYHGNDQIKAAAYADFTAWIHEQGGMHKVLNMMYPSDYPRNVEVDTDTEHMENWIVPVVPPPTSRLGCVSRCNIGY